MKGWAFPELVVALGLAALFLAFGQAAPEGVVEPLEVVIPEHQADGEVYLCTRVPLAATSQRLVGVEPLSKQEVVHHMLLYGMSCVI